MSSERTISSIPNKEEKEMNTNTVTAQAAMTTIEQKLPNSKLEEAFYKCYADYDQVVTFRKLKAEGNTASATALATRVVIGRLYELLDREEEKKATVTKYEGPSIYDLAPELCK
jgi:hypothetical protein